MASFATRCLCVRGLYFSQEKIKCFTAESAANDMSIQSRGITLTSETVELESKSFPIPTT
jgi:hypothetical protein